MKMNYVKLVVSAVSAFVLSLFGILAPWVGVLVVAMILDYASGMSSAWYKDELNSRVGVVGVLKKIGYLILVAVAMIIDWVLINGGNLIGVKLPIEGFIALLVIIWLIINEAISITENLSEIGVKVPGWLGKLMGHLKAVSENKGDELNA